MADGTFEFFNSPEAAYASKPNIRYPGTQALANAAATRAVAVINDRLPTGVTISGLTVTAANS